MNKAKFSAAKSLLNSWHYNGFFKTIQLLFDFIFIKLKIKKNSSFNGIRIFLRNGTSDLPVFRQVFMDHEYLIDLKKETIKTIIDGGCNIGLAAIYFHSLFPEAKIVGIEPDENNFKQATLNTRSIKNISVNKAGVWNKNCFLKTQSDPVYGEWGVTVVETDNSENNGIKAMTIDSIMQQNNFETIDILKLDIEGSEYEVFQLGYQTWLPKTRIIIIELHDFMKANSSAVFFKALADANINYAMAQRGENVLIFNNSFISK